MRSGVSGGVFTTEPGTFLSSRNTLSPKIMKPSHVHLHPSPVVTRMHPLHSALIAGILGFSSVFAIPAGPQWNFDLAPQLEADANQADEAILKDLKIALKHYVAGEFAESLAIAQTAAAAAPKSYVALGLVGACQLRLGDFDQGIASLLTASRLGPDKIAPLLEIGDAYLTRGDLAQARKYFQMILDRRANEPAGHQGLGLVSEREDKLDEAVAHFEAGIRDQPPGTYGVNVNLARLYNSRKEFPKTIALLGETVRKNPTNESAVEFLATAYVGAGNLTEAIAIYEAASTTSPSARVSLGLGIIFREANQLPKSIEAIKQAISLRANWDLAWSQLAETQIVAGDFPGALVSLNQAKSSGSDIAVTDSRMGEVYLLTKDYPKAIAIFEKLLAANVGDPFMRDRLGTSYQAGGDVASAERIYQESEKRFPTDSLPPFRLGVLYDQAKRFPEAIARLTSALALSPENLAIQRALAISLTKGGQRDQALKIARLMEEKHPTPESKLFLAELCSQSNDDAQANTIYQELLVTNPDHVVALNNHAMALARVGKFDDALRHARHAVSLVPGNGQLLDTLGWITYLQGETAPASALLRKAVELSPKDPSILFHLGMACSRQNQDLEALDAFKRAMALSKDFPEYQQAAEMVRKAGNMPK